MTMFRGLTHSQKAMWHSVVNLGGKRSRDVTCPEWALDEAGHFVSNIYHLSRGLNGLQTINEHRFIKKLED